MVNLSLVWYNLTNIFMVQLVGIYRKIINMQENKSSK